VEPRIEVVGRLDAGELERVTTLVEHATETDGARPLSEHVALHLRHGGDTAVRHVLAYDGDVLVGYAHVDPTDVVAGSSAELVVDPSHRNHGIGRRLVSESLAVAPDGRLRLWAHGDHPGAARLAESFGMTRTRILWQLRRSLFAPLPPATFPDGVSVRTFRPGADDDAWLALNAKAFAEHPEQGAWGPADLHLRMAESWFDPLGFFLAERDAPADPRLVGFHWTKVHGGEPDAHTHGHTHNDPATHAAHVHPHAHDAGDRSDVHGHAPIGEVYVVGVDETERGNGLGRALTLIGLTHLRAQGLPDVMLYVDADNTAAHHLYESLGFARWSKDVMFGT
jgi:mycothiol synthase